MLESGEALSGKQSPHGQNFGLSFRRIGRDGGKAGRRLATREGTDAYQSARCQDNGTFTIMDTKHRDHSYFAEFQAWAQANRLQIVGVCPDSGSKSGFKFYVVSIQ